MAPHRNAFHPSTCVSFGCRIEYEFDDELPLDQIEGSFTLYAVHSKCEAHKDLTDVQVYQLAIGENKAHAQALYALGRELAATHCFSQDEIDTATTALGGLDMVDALGLQLPTAGAFKPSKRPTLTYVATPQALGRTLQIAVPGLDTKGAHDALVTKVGRDAGVPVQSVFTKAVVKGG